MCKMETTLIEYANDLKVKRQLGWLPSKLYDMLEENLPHGLVVQLGEIIMKNKGSAKFK